MTDMLVRLYDLPDSAAYRARLDDLGVVVRRAMSYDKRTVVKWVMATFGEGWTSECEAAFANQPVTCFLALEAGSVIGFACYDATCRDFFGPAGVDETRRGRGIGAALLLSCLEAMRSEGYAYAIIGGVGPQEFYTRVAGATVIPNSSPGVYRDLLCTN